MPVFRAFLEGFVAFGDNKRAFFDVRECRWRLQALKITLRDRPADAFLIGFLPAPSRVWGGGWFDLKALPKTKKGQRRGASGLLKG